MGKRMTRIALLGLVLSSLRAVLAQEPSPIEFTCTTATFNPVCNVNAKAPKPKHMHCGDAGTVTTESLLAYPCGATSEDNCRDWCLGTPGCKSFSFDPAQDNRCALYSAKINRQNFNRDSTSTQQFWNNKCFTFSTGGCNPRPVPDKVCAYQYLPNSDQAPSYQVFEEVRSGQTLFASSQAQAPIVYSLGGITEDPTGDPSDINNDCDALNICANKALALADYEDLLSYSRGWIDVKYDTTGQYTCSIFPNNQGYLNDLYDDSVVLDYSFWYYEAVEAPK